jgi:hypothetical protein
MFIYCCIPGVKVVIIIKRENSLKEFVASEGYY